MPFHMTHPTTWLGAQDSAAPIGGRGRPRLVCGLTERTPLCSIVLAGGGHFTNALYYSPDGMAFHPSLLDSFDHELMLTLPGFPASAVSAVNCTDGWFGLKSSGETGLTILRYTNVSARVGVGDILHGCLPLC